MKKWPEHNVVSFFDSYGDFPDDQKQFVNNEFLVRSGLAFNYICRLLHKASFKYTVEFSHSTIYRRRTNMWLRVDSGVVCLCSTRGPGVDGFYWHIRDFGNP